MTRIEISDKAAETILGLLFYAPSDKELLNTIERNAIAEAKAALIAALNEKVATV